MKGIRVAGSGTVEVESIPVETKSLSDWSTDLPFTFDIQLNHGLRIDEVHFLRVDTSSFDL